MGTQPATETTALALNPRTILADLEKLKPQMEAALPRHMNPDRMARIVLTEMRKTPKLFMCTRESVFGSIIAASQLGLEPGIMGQCYLIPYKDTCTLVPGWKGYMDLLSRTGRAGAWTGAVYEDDEFDFEYGDRPSIHHKPGKWSKNPAALIYTYSVGRVNGMEWPVIDVWDIDKIWDHRGKMNKVGDRHYSYAYPEMYARKIPLLQVVKYMPTSVELTSAQALDHAAAEGKQKLTIDMALGNELESGGEEVDDFTEADRLMDEQHYDDKRRAAAKDMYTGRVADLIKYLREQRSTTGNGNGQKSADTAKAAETNPSGAPTAVTGSKPATSAPRGKPAW
ncbi:MAG TPA: recombinase RecT [Acidobacteriaceae bacterium]|jgi:recombination protein RecT